MSDLSSQRVHAPKHIRSESLPPQIEKGESERMPRTEAPCHGAGRAQYTHGEPEQYGMHADKRHEATECLGDDSGGSPALGGGHGSPAGIAYRPGETCAAGRAG